MHVKVPTSASVALEHLQYLASAARLGVMSEEFLRVGSEDRAYAALVIHDVARDHRLAGDEGVLSGWRLYRGASRTAWHDVAGSVVYKIETAPDGSNHVEHHNARLLRELGKSWAPDTSLYQFRDASARTILAMPYYPAVVRSHSEIPEDALALAPDLLLDNFRRTAELPSGHVKVVDLGGIMPALQQIATAAARGRLGIAPMATFRTQRN